MSQDQATERTTAEDRVGRIRGEVGFMPLYWARHKAEFGNRGGAQGRKRPKRLKKGTFARFFAGAGSIHESGVKVQKGKDYD